jgi:glycerophosphoryl diester phosphodiesterase
MATPTPRVIAHRGFAERFPENTLISLQAAIDLGVDAVEFDVQFTVDGVPVLLHDGTLDRTTTRSGSAWARSSEDLRDEPAHEPERLGERYRGSCLPRLDAVATLAASHPDVELFVEIKAESLAIHGVSHSVAAVLEALGSALPRCWIISFVPAAIQEARRLGAPRIGWCLPAYDEPHRERARALAPDLLFVDERQLGGGREPLWPGPWRWAAWEVVDTARARALAGRGLDYAETMRVEALLAGLGRGASAAGP